jgi:fumarate hydratase class II
MVASHRIENDSLGEVHIQKNKYWGAQTQRALNNFSYGKETMPIEMIFSYAKIKMASAIANRNLGILSKDKSLAIVKACEEILKGILNEHFPLTIWQSGSGTQTNMNLNEVIANRGNEILGYKLGGKKVIHPNDHCNKSQSTNDTFPMAMHLSVYQMIVQKALPTFEALLGELSNKINVYRDLIKVGRTHLMDATPITVGQEFSAHYWQIKVSLEQLKNSANLLLDLPVGGTAVGTGINAHSKFAETCLEEIKNLTGYKFRLAQNKYALIASHDALFHVSSCLKNCSISVFKLANDIRLLASGPRCGLGEIKLPENEPGSSIMPGKVNPGQIEALLMVISQIVGMDHAVTLSGLGGILELNTYKPLVAFNILTMGNLLSEGVYSFSERCLKGMTVNVHKIKSYFENSLMIGTSLTPILGYENAAKVVQEAIRDGLSIREVVLAKKLMTEEKFEEAISFEKLIPSFQEEFYV